MVPRIVGNSISSVDPKSWLQVASRMLLGGFVLANRGVPERVSVLR